MSTTTLTSEVAGLADDSGQIISGVAVGVDDVTRGLSGDRKVWTADELRAAASSLEGTPVNPLHSEQDVGEVIRAGFDADRGVIYEAELDDESLADQAGQGHLEVSIEARHADGGEVDTSQGDAMLATDIDFTGLSLVQRGAAPSASASPGEAAALSATAIHAALAEDDPASTEGDAEDIEISDEVEEGLENKVDEHNEDAPESKQVDLGMLKKVFRRGAGAWLRSNAGATQQQWAYARVNAFLEDLNADRPLNSGNDNDLAPDGYDVAENAGLVEVNGEEVDIEPPEAVVNAAEEALEAKAEYDGIGDCGTGVGETRAEQITSGDLSPEDFTSGGQAETAIPDYLNSHEEDVSGIDETPTQWGEETWTDGCGPVQYALWGGTATGTGLEWAQSTADAIEDAMDDAEMAYNSDESANMAEVPDAYVFSNPGEAVSKAQEMGLDGPGDEVIHTHGEGEDTVFMPAPSHDELMDMLEEMDELAEADLKGVGPVEFTGTADGDLDESEIPSEGFEPHYLNAGDTKSESTFPLVDADGDLRRGNVEAAWNLRGQGDLGMPRDAAERVMRSLAEEFGEAGSEANPLPEDAYEEADMAAAGTDDAVSPEDGQAEAGGERTGTKPTTETEHMSENEEELRARLSSKDDRIAELQNEVEQLEDEREDVARAYAEALAAGDTVFDEDDLVEKFTVAELSEKIEATEDATLAETEPTVQSGNSNEETATLSDAEQDEVAELRSAISDLSGSETRLAEIQREQHAERIAELTDEDAEAVLAEV